MKHGHSTRRLGASATYNSWRAMMERTKRNKRYIARNITVCERWQLFENFLADMGERPVDLFLERIDNDKGYEPDNCEWKDRLAQNRNRTSTKLCQGDVDAILVANNSGESAYSIAARWNISHTYAKNLINGKRWCRRTV